MKILGIETSCDETSVSVVENGRKILSNIIHSQIDIHTLYGGVVPEIASRSHVERISELVSEAFEKAELSIGDIDAIAVTNAPGLIGALLVGLNFAKSLAFSLNKPLIPVHHIRGHIAGLYLSYPELKPPFSVLVVSGGHTMIAHVEDYTRYEILGSSKDDAAGECFDKVARVLDLGYPGGPKIEKMAENGNPDAIKFPMVNFEQNPYDFSFSGVKTAVINYVHNIKQAEAALNKADIAASFTKAVCTVLVKKSVMAAKKYNKLVIAGGVAANNNLREDLKKACSEQNIELFLPEKHLCTDNGAMIAAQGYYEYLNGNISGNDLNAFPTQNLAFNS